MQSACGIPSSGAYMAPQYFSTLSHKGAILKNKLLNIKYVFQFSLQFFPKHFSFYKEMSEI